MLHSPQCPVSIHVDLSIKKPQPVATGRGRNKNLGPYLAAAAMKFGLIGAMTFKGLTLLVGKALMISKIALLLATIVGLKKLFSHQQLASRWHWLYRRYCACVIPLLAPQSGDPCLLRVSVLRHLLKKYCINK
ncbi:hypothetical protein EVAR_12266_1 [Eumeta japonica]|uniref:Uncharacterized protein n=1 Tax=Eumeta variegata TaxID=151549 RepID=A0A4C1TUV3_EUMVA|nr:hypothetical protein EVAR_12266_1 [Eumeta japonica]